MDQHKRTIVILLAFALLMLCTTGCSIIKRDHFWIPENGYAGTSYSFIFQHEKVYLRVHDLPAKDETYFFGFPLVPIIPFFLIHPPSGINIWLAIEINSPDDTTIIDFYNVRLRFSEGKISQLKSIWEMREKGQGEVRIEIGRTSIANRNAFYILDFGYVPYSTEEIRLDFGDLEINGNDVKVPAFKWHRIRHYRYDPLHLVSSLWFSLTLLSGLS